MIRLIRKGLSIKAAEDKISMTQRFYLTWNHSPPMSHVFPLSDHAERGEIDEGFPSPFQTCKFPFLFLGKLLWKFNVFKRLRKLYKIVQTLCVCV